MLKLTGFKDPSLKIRAVRHKHAIHTLTAMKQKAMEHFTLIELTFYKVSFELQAIYNTNGDL